MLGREGRPMTEAEWLAWDDLLRDARLDFVSEKVSERKLRLLGCACCLHIRELIPDVTSFRAIELAERFADGEATGGDLVVLQTDDYYRTPEHYPQKARCARWAAMWTAVRPFDARAAKYCGGNAAQAHSILSNAPIHDEYRREYTDDQRSAWIVSVQLALLGDIIGNPFRPVTFSPEWRTDTAIAIAQQMYDAREFSAMPILADALQDAGCDSEDILSHCRGAGPHVRGCWVVDSVLGKG